MSDYAESSTEGAQERKPPQKSMWIARLEAAKTAAKPHWEDTKSSWDEFLGGGQQTRDPSKIPAARFSLWWSSVKNLQPMYYSRTPIPVAEKVFDDLDDNQARLGAIQSERLAKYLMRSCAFDRTMTSTRDTYIHSAKATPRVVFDSDWSYSPKREYYTQIEIPAPPPPQPQPVPSAPGQQLPPGLPPQQGLPPQLGQIPSSPPASAMPSAMTSIWVNADGDQLEDPTALQEDDSGYYIELDEDEEKLERVRVDLVNVHTKDLLHNPDARSWEEVYWIAFGSNISKFEFKRRFGQDAYEQCSSAFIDNSDEANKTADSAAKSTAQLTARVWEIWNKEEREVYWLVENYDEAFVEPLNYEGGDPYGLDGFWPCPPFILGTVGPDSLYPVPDIVQLRPMISQINGLAQRLQNLVLAAKVLGLYDDDAEALKMLSSLQDAVPFIGVPNLASLVGDAGLDKLVWYFPIEKIVESINVTIQVMETYSKKFNEILGIPDIVRGVSDPNETAEAQQMKGRYLSLRADAPCREFQRLTRDAIELMMDLALKKFPASKLAEVTGVSRLKPEDQKIWPQTLLLLQDDCERKIRIDIETDSTITMNQNAEIEQTNFLAKTILDGFAGIASATEQNKLFGPAAVEVLLLVVGKLQRGKSMETTLRRLQEELAVAAKQPPAPDPKIAIEKFKAESKAQTEQARTQGQLQIAQTQSQAQIQQIQLEAEADMAVEQMRAQADIAVQRSKAEAEIVSEREQSKAKIEMQRESADLDARLDVFKARTAMAQTEHQARASSATEAQKVAGTLEVQKQKAKDAGEAAKMKAKQQPKGKPK